MAEPKRDRWGRYILTDPTTDEEKEVPWTRATTLAGALEDSHGLMEWKQRGTIIGLTLRDDLWDLACACDPEDKQQLNDLAEKALVASGADKRANQGTALHKFTARLDAGELSRSPRKWDERLRAYTAFKEREGIETHPRFIERITVVPELSTAGTMDRIAKHEGEPKIADLKTGQSLKYDAMKIHVQLALYSRGAGLWNEQTGKWDKMPRVSQTEGIVIHLPAEPDEETGEPIQPVLYRVDLELGWKLAQTAYWIRELRKDKTLLKRDDAA